MARALWFTALACALGVLAVVLLVRELAPATSAVPDAKGVAAIEHQRGFELEATTAVPAAERSAVEAPAAAPEASAPIRSDAALTRALHDIGVEIEPPPAFRSGVIEVRVVRDEDGAPIPSARVEIALEWGPEAAETDANGRVEFSDVVEGRSTLTARIDGRVPVVGYAAISPREPHASVELRASVQRTVVVRLVDPAGAPFRADALGFDRRVAQRIGIVLSRTCGAVGQESTGSDAPAYSARTATGLDHPAAWNVELRGVTDEVCVHALLADTIVGTARLDPSATEISVRVDVAAARAAVVPVVVRVLDARDDTPVEGAYVEFGVALPGDSAPRTGPDGRTRGELVPIRTSAVTVSARKFGRVTVTLAAPIPPEVVVRLNPTRRISGRVVGGDGAPLASAYVSARADGGPLDVSLSVPTEDDGSFEIVDVPAAKLRVMAVYRGNGTQQPVTVDCTRENANGIELRIELAKAEAPAPR